MFDPCAMANGLIALLSNILLTKPTFIYSNRTTPIEDIDLYDNITMFLPTKKRLMLQIIFANFWIFETSNCFLVLLHIYSLRKIVYKNHLTKIITTKLSQTTYWWPFSHYLSLLITKANWQGCQIQKKSKSQIWPSVVSKIPNKDKILFI